MTKGGLNKPTKNERSIVRSASLSTPSEWGTSTRPARDISRLSRSTFYLERRIIASSVRRGSEAGDAALTTTRTRPLTRWWRRRSCTCAGHTIRATGIVWYLQHYHGIRTSDARPSIGSANGMASTDFRTEWDGVPYAPPSLQAGSRPPRAGRREVPDFGTEERRAGATLPVHGHR